MEKIGLYLHAEEEDSEEGVGINGPRPLQKRRWMRSWESVGGSSLIKRWV